LSSQKSPLKEPVRCLSLSAEKQQTYGVDREVQRALNLSTPSLAAYHLAKLEDAGLIKKEKGTYVINKVVLEDYIKITGS
jgi:hypothetical protein